VISRRDLSHGDGDRKAVGLVVIERHDESAALTGGQLRGGTRLPRDLGGGCDRTQRGGRGEGDQRRDDKDHLDDQTM
jgi:hypothetical protein